MGRDYNEIINRCKELMQYIKDSYTQKAIIDFFNEDIKTYKDVTYSKFKAYLWGWQMFITLIKDYKLEELNWEVLCNFQHLNLNEVLEKNKTYIDIEVNDTKFSRDNKVTAFIKARKLVSEFYLYIIKDNKYELQNIKEIHKYKKLIIPIKRESTTAGLSIFYDKLKDIYTSKIMTNYPIDSHYTSIAQLKIKERYGDYISNINLNCDNKVLVQLFSQYIKYHEEVNQDFSNLKKIFIYFFMDSFKGTEITSIEDLSYEVFKKQYEYYKAKDLDLDTDFENGITLIHCLINFYRFLIIYIKKIDINQHIFGNEIFERALMLKLFIRYFDGGYKFSYFNIFDEIPEEDKLVFIPQEQEFNSTHNKNDASFSVDFTKIHSKFRLDVKEMFWSTKGSAKEKAKGFLYLVEFINFKLKYDEKIKSISNEELNKEFHTEFLMDYREYSEGKYENSATLKGALKVIRKFLKFVNNKYKVLETDIDILNLKGLGNYDGGNPITKHDMELIYNQFKSIEKETRNGEIYTLVFMIFSVTNLRFGEILNLKRDCIIKDSIEADGSAYIKDLKKLSNGELVNQKVTEEVRYLIEKSIKYTQDLIDKNYFKDAMENYIFIEDYQINTVQKLKRLNFNYYFRDKILKLIIDELEKKDYTVNNIRHTYVHSVYEEGIKQNMSLLDISAVTGNSYKVANQYYRKYSELKMYVETMSKIVISDVDIKGEIKYSEENNDVSIVKGELGTCKEKQCIDNYGECLRCHHFVTFLNKIPLFEQMIQEYNLKVQNSENILERQGYIEQIRLMSAYLYNMLKIKEGKSS